MATKKTKNIGYSEPSNYFPKSVRKSAKIGEYSETNKTTKKKVVKGKK